MSETGSGHLASAGAIALPRARLVATDLDGTLLRPDGTLSAFTRAVLHRVQAAGVQIVLVTARPPRTARLLARAAGVDGLVICCNGALIYDLAAEAIMAHAPLDPDVARAVVSALRAALSGTCFALELGMTFGCEPAYAALESTVGLRPEDAGAMVNDALALCAAPVTKLIVRHPEHAPEALLAIVQALADNRLAVTHSGAPFVEISAAGVHKASALAAVCADLGVDRQEVVSFGDMPNDLPMLRWAGRGVAVANAHPDVLAEVREITGTNADDGVARALERLFPESCAGHGAGASTQSRRTAPTTR